MNEHDEERMQRYLDDEMDAEERSAYERVLRASPERMGEAYDELAARDALAETVARSRSGRVTRTRSPWRRRRWLAALATVAAILAGVAILRPVAPPTEVYRSGAPGSPRALAPSGVSKEVPLNFSWTRDADAERYRFEIFDDEGLPAYVRILTDTSVTFATGDSIPLRGAWRATALDEFGIGARSTGRVEFEVRD